MSGRGVRGTPVTVLLILLAASCTPGDGPDPDGTDTGRQTVRIALIGDMSGPDRDRVVHVFQAAELAIAQAAGPGGGGGARLPVDVELVRFDTEGSSAVAADAAAQVEADPSFVGVIGPATAEDTEAAGDVLDAAGIPFVTPSATADDLADRGWANWFRSVAGGGDVASPAARFITNVVAPASACVAADSSDLATTLKDAVVALLLESGVEVPVDVELEEGARDFSLLVTQIAAAGCPALFISGSAPEAGAIRSQLDTAGLEHVIMVGGDGIMREDFLSTAGDAAEGTIAICPCSDLSTSADPAAQQFISDYQAEYGVAPGPYGAESYDVAQIFLAAVKVGSTTREEVSSFVRDLPGFQGLTKSYTFLENGELAPDSQILYFYEVQSGDWVPVGPSDQVLAI